LRELTEFECSELVRSFQKAVEKEGYVVAGKDHFVAQEMNRVIKRSWSIGYAEGVKDSIVILRGVEQHEAADFVIKLRGY
jgi:hypothetical protein